jgi:hypothetical protein
MRVQTLGPPVPVTGTTTVAGTITVSTRGGTVAVTWFAESCPAESAEGSDPKALNNKPARTNNEMKIGLSFITSSFRHFKPTLRVEHIFASSCKKRQSIATVSSFS